jgi:DNA-binding response OmpR family regulator
LCASRPEKPAAGGERVLFIEDSPTLAQLLEISLVQAGYEVVRAGSGEEGLELARPNRRTCSCAT